MFFEDGVRRIGKWASILTPPTSCCFLKQLLEVACFLRALGLPVYGSFSL